MSQAAASQIEALLRFWTMAQQNHGGARVAVKLLLGLYNGPRFPFDLTELRGLDAANLDDAFAVMRMDSRPQAEVHVLIDRATGRMDTCSRFELLACEWRLKGKCSKEDEQEIRAWFARQKAVATC